jgi:hypothetical protein
LEERSVNKAEIICEVCGSEKHTIWLSETALTHYSNIHHTHTVVFRLEMSGNLSFRDVKVASGETLISVTEINERRGFI